MKIIATNDIGELGDKQSQPVIYFWKIYYHFPSLILWLILLVVLLLKENRTYEAWLIFIPMFVLFALWGIAKQVFGLPSEASNLLGYHVYSFAITMAILWLLGRRFRNRKGIVSFFIALVVMIILGLIASFSFSGASLKREAAALLITYCVWAIVTLLALTITALRCREMYSPKRFMLTLLLWMIILSVVFIIVYVILVGCLTGYIRILLEFMKILVMGSIFGLVFYLFILPYMILALKSSFYRERFYGCFGILDKSHDESDSQITQNELKF